MKLSKLISLCAVASAFCACSSPQVKAPEAILPIPEQKQVDWQKMETYAFIHFGLNTFNDREWGYGDTDPKIFNPARLDCEQWAQTLVKAGMKGVILTAKHHDGFCLWPFEGTDYNISHTPYKDGKGDIVRELADACKKYGLKFAVYLSPWDRHQANYGTPEYLDYFYAQLRELLTNYGEVFEVWFDGANGGDGWYGGAKDVRTIDRKNYYNYPRIYEILDSIQPQAVIFSDGGPGCRWVGNERGFAGATNWSFLRKGEVYPGYPKHYELQYGHADGNQWVPAECDVSIRPGWFYHPEEDDRVKTPEQLVDLYYRSVGHNGTLLLNFPVDRNGLINPIDSANAVKYYQIIQQELKNNLEAGMKANKEKPQGMAAMMTAMGKAPKEYSKEEIELALAIAEVERTIKNVGNYKNALLTSPEEELSSLMNALKGGYTAPTPGGDPIANPNALPTGRNMYAINAEATPTESAWEKGIALAKQTIDTYKQRHNDSIPRKVSYTLWSSEFIETGGATIAKVQYMLGVEPVREAFGRVCDLKLNPSA